MSVYRSEENQELQLPSMFCLRGSVNGLELARASWPMSFMVKIVSTPISPLLGPQACAITLGFFRWVLKITGFYLGCRVLNQVPHALETSVFLIKPSPWSPKGCGFQHI